MKSRVYFISVSNTDTEETIRQKLARLLEKSGALEFINKGQRVAVKLHFGEEGNRGYVKPGYVRIVCEHIRHRQAEPFLADTNTLYRGKRMNSKDHGTLAAEHGFTEESVGARVFIPDDSQKEELAEIAVGGRYIKSAKIAKAFVDADVLVGIAHFKGHLMAGFGGALKNIGMGCATREGKLIQHCDIAPFIKEKKCAGCRQCEAVCPARAIVMRNNKAVLDVSLCIGCASCIAACTHDAIDIKWEAGGGLLQQKMAEYAKAVLHGKEKKAVFINFVLKVTKECDCMAKDDPRIVPDIGICISDDPVSLDKACLDLVMEAAGKDIFKEVHPKRDGNIQLKHAAKIGLGNLEYELTMV
ncbi:MAG: DUF362 domain-containing protein [Candidatus Omnitrophota bacterium]|jgi:hypothetical protein